MVANILLSSRHCANEQAISYRSQTNGRAERACGMLLEKLKLLHKAKELE